MHLDENKGAYTCEIEDLINHRYTEDYLKMEPISVSECVGLNIEILKMYLGWDPKSPCFGQILAVLKYGERFFEVKFHVWSDHQQPSMANRLTEISELMCTIHMGLYFLRSVWTDFGKKAFWLYTPDSVLDKESLALRAVAKELRKYSVRNQLCKKFRNTYKKGVKENGKQNF